MKGTKFAITSKMRFWSRRFSAANTPQQPAKGRQQRGLLGEEERTEQRVQCSCIRRCCSFIAGIVPLRRISQSEAKFGEGGDGNAGGKQHLPEPRMFGGSAAVTQSVVS